MATGALAEDAPTDNPAAVAVADEENKVFVCKYVGTPGDNESCRTAATTLSVSVDSITSKFNGGVVTVGSILRRLARDARSWSRSTPARPTPPESACAGARIPRRTSRFRASSTPDRLVHLRRGGARSTQSFLGQPLSAEGSVYQFENIYVEVDRSVAGQVTLTIWPIDGFTISGLSDAWDEGEGNFFRTIELNGPVPCPLADIPVTLTAPAL